MTSALERRSTPWQSWLGVVITKKGIGCPGRDSTGLLLFPTPKHSRLAAWVGLLLLLSCFSAWSASVQASLDRDSIALGETANLSLVLDGASLQGGPPPIPAPAGLRITSAGQSTQISIVQGQQSMQVTLSYVVEPIRMGSFVIPTIVVPTDAGPLRTRPLSLKVSAAAAVTPGEGPAFLQIVPKKTSLYLGEPLPLEIRLYAEEGRLLEGPQPAGEGFNFGKVLDQPSQSRVRINNRNMTLVVFRVLSMPVKSGKLQLGPISLAMSVPAPGARVDFFGFRQSQNIRVVAEPVEVNVLPLPPGAPPGFTGAVGKFDLEYTAAPTAVTVGDPITLKIQISGSGLMDRVSLPSLDDWKGFKFYPPNSRTEMADPMEIAGTKFFEQVVVPQSPEVTSLPEFRWSYFDPEEKAYKTLRGAALPLQLSAAASTTTPTPSLAGSRNSNASDTTPGLAHIRPQLGMVMQPPAALWRQGWFIGLEALPIAIWGFLRFRRWQTEQLARNPRRVRSRELDQKVSDGLKNLRRQASSNQAAEFFATLTQVLRCQIAQRLDLQEQSITEAVIEERLKPLGLAPQEAAELEDLFRCVNQFHYAPQSTPGQMNDLVPRVERAVESLRRLPEVS